jgi:hypothetical protein
VSEGSLSRLELVGDSGGMGCVSIMLLVSKEAAEEELMRIKAPKWK